MVTTCNIQTDYLDQHNCFQLAVTKEKRENIEPFEDQNNLPSALVVLIGSAAFAHDTSVRFHLD